MAEEVYESSILLRNGELTRPIIEPSNQESELPMLLSEAEGDTRHGVIPKSCSDPARSEILRTLGIPSRRNW